MEIRHELTQADDRQLHATARALRAVGLGAFASHYYTHDNGKGPPFFKLSAPFAKETPDEPDTVELFLDVDSEFTVYAFFGHEHFNTADEAVTLLKRLYDGTYCEVVTVYDALRIVAFLPNTGDPQRNVGQMASQWTDISRLLNGLSFDGWQNAHFPFSAFAPYLLQVHQSKPAPIEGRSRYLISIVFGAQPEYYL